MKRTPFTAAITAALLLAAPALAQTVPPAMISVTGEAIISGADAIGELHNLCVAGAGPLAL